MAARYAGLTTVRQPMRELGATAARLLDELITGARTEPRHELLPTELVIRTSTTHPEGTPMKRPRIDHVQRGAATAIALAAAASLVLTACGRDDDAGAGGEAQSEAIDDGQGHRHHRRLGDGHRGRDAPGLLEPTSRRPTPTPTVKVTAIPWEAAHDKIAGAIASGETPDVSLIGTTWMGEFAEAGGLMPTPEGLVDEADFFPGAWGSTEVGGTSYGVPWYVETRVLYYRTDLAEKAGWAEAPQTWDELKTFAAGPGEQGRRGVRPQPPARPDRLVADRAAVRLVQRRRAHQRGRHRVHDRLPGDGRGARLLHVVLRRGALARPGCSTRASSRAASPRAPTARSSPARGTPAWSRTPASTPDQYAVAPLPGTDCAPGTSFVGGGDLAVFKDSDNADDAWKYVQWLSEPETQQDVLRRGRRPAGRAGRLGHRRARRRPAAAGLRRSSSRAPSRPPAVPTWEQVAGVDRRDHRAGVEGRPVRRGRGQADAVRGLVDRHRSLTMTTTTRRGPDRRDRPPVAAAEASGDADPARRPHAAAAGCRRVGPRPAVHGAVPGLHRRAGAGQPRHELHRHPQHRHAQPVRGGVRRARQLRRPARRPAVPQGHGQHVPLPRPRRAADDGASRWPRRSGSTGSPGCKGFFRVGFYLPVVTSIVAVSVVWKFLLRDDGGLVNTVLGWVGIDGPGWLDSTTHRAADAGGDGGVAQLRHADGDLPGRRCRPIPRELLEAAEADGAAGWARFRYITLPMLRPTLLFGAVITSIGYLQFFEEAFVMTKGGPLDSTRSVTFFTYDQFGFGNYGVGSRRGVPAVPRDRAC